MTDPLKTVCVDLDGTLRGTDGKVTAGAIDAIVKLRAAGFCVLIWTAISDPAEVAQAKKWLSDCGIVHDGFVSDSKPPACAYVDDHAVRFEGDWNSVISTILPHRRANLHLLVGLPGSGKSTFAKVAVQDAVRISQDSLVGALDGDQKMATIASAAVAADALRSGRDVVVDRLSLTAKSRSTWVRLARDCGADCIGYFWDIGVEKNWLGNLARPQRKHVEVEKLRRMASKLERPTLDEGFAQLFVVVEDEFGFRELRPAVS